ncbi:MAG: HlyC/CorC family transporter [Chromatiales bacterium]|nr:HlyC/CorC family transporter [Gammaproteobacteria bacterium]MBW6476181.1 HlyC/CorC family transporter [Chromatiales bacterium]
MLTDIPIWLLLTSLFVLILLSAFFSGSETGLISLNRYRLRHMSRDGHPGAVRASELLKRPDRLIGVILLGNNFVNILASAIATIIALRLIGEEGIMIATLLLTLVILIFAEITPKTLAALHPERVAFPATLIIRPLLKTLYPLIWLINTIPSGLLRLLGVSQRALEGHHLSSDELRTVVNEAGSLIPQRHQEMLLSILDLEQVTVEDIMVPRNEITGIDLDDDWETILKQISTSQHTRLPVYRGDIDNVLGFIHLRNVLALGANRSPQREELEKVIREAYFIPEGTPLHTQLLNFQAQRRRIGLVVDEYGDIRGLVTLDDILEEIVGEFTTDPAAATSKDIHPQEDGSFLVDGGTNIRELNRIMQWDLPTNGPKTLNGMITEYLETIPEPGTSLLLQGYPIEIMQTANNSIKTVRIDPRLDKTE